MKKTTYGYIRVSSIDQNEDRQRIELLNYRILEENLFSDKISGKDFNRPNYQKLRSLLSSGDCLVVKSIDRLGRNYNAIQEEWRYLVKEQNIDIVILDMPILDTRKNKDLIGTLISDIVLQLLSYVAQTERENIKKRQAEGIAAAKLRGIHLGRKAIPLPETFPFIYEKWKKKELHYQDAMLELGMTQGQFYSSIKKYRSYSVSKNSKNT